MSRPLPAVGPARGLPEIPVQKHTLANGLRVAIIERRDLPVVDVEVVITAGAELDMPLHAGRASLTAELIDEGTPTRAALEIAEEIDQLGAQLDIQIGWDSTTAAVHVLSLRLEPALDVLADLIVNPAFPEDEFARKHKERLAALSQERDEARLLARKALAAGVFGTTHPFGAPPGGTEASVTRLKREDAVAFYNNNFTPANAFVLVVGDVDSAAILAAIDARFGAWRDDRIARPAEVAPVPNAERRVLLVDKKDAAQAELVVGHAGPPRNTNDYFELIVLNTLFGGSFTSRLNTILRERMGVTYGASSRFGFRRSGGIFTVGAAVFTESVARSAQVAVEEMERLTNEKVEAGELRRTQNYIALGLPRSFETTEDIAARLREQLVYGLPDDYWQTYVERVFAVTADDVLRAAARHLQPHGCAIAVVADRKKVQQELERVKLGAVLPTSVAT